MGRFSVTLCLALLCGTGWGDFKPCKFSDLTSVGQSEGVSVQRLTILEPNEQISATILLPKDPAPVPGIIFSYSQIVGPASKVDLARFAMGLARAGAAVIVLDGSINWNPPNDDAERSPHVWACAGQWLLLHARLDINRLAEAGPKRHWGGGDTPLCMEGESPCWHGVGWLNFGQTTDAEYQNTENMLRFGCSGMASAAQRWLKLRSVEGKWLNVEKISP